MSLISAGMTASFPYVSRNGVSPVGVLAVVLYAHSTLDNSSSHMPFAPSSLDDFEQGSVRNLNLPVSLWVGGGGVVVPNS